MWNHHWYWSWSCDLGTVYLVSPPVKLFIFPLSILYSLEGSHCVQSTCKEWGVIILLLRVDYLENLFVILLNERFVSSPFIHLFNHTFISVWIINTYFIFWIIIEYYFIDFVAEIVLVWTIGNTFGWLLCSFYTPSSM